VKEKKISGSSQANKRDSVLQHGTLLLDVDFERMFTLLRVPWAKTSMEVVNVARERITSIKTELGHAISPDTAANALEFGFSNALSAQMVEGRLTPFETELAKKLNEDKYTTEQWNFHGTSILN